MSLVSELNEHAPSRGRYSTTASSSTYPVHCTPSWPSYTHTCLSISTARASSQTHLGPVFLAKTNPAPYDTPSRRSHPCACPRVRHIVNCCISVLPSICISTWASLQPPWTEQSRNLASGRHRPTMNHDGAGTTRWASSEVDVDPARETGGCGLGQFLLGMVDTATTSTPVK